MDAVSMLKQRRSVRKYKDEKVDRATMKEIIDISRWAPSWANFQVARYTLIDDAALIEKLAATCVKGFTYNIKTLQKAPGVAILSYVKGKSGRLEQYDVESGADADVWEIFDAGIACQTFCLAAHAKGVGTCIFGVIDNDAIARLIELPTEETVAALIVYGYEDGHPEPTSRMEAEEIMRFFDAN